MSQALELQWLAGRTITGISLRVFPPCGETERSHTDIALCLDLEGEGSAPDSVLIAISGEDNWSPFVERICIERRFPWESLTSRLQAWMAASCEAAFEHEFYDATRSEAFSGFAGKQIDRVQALCLSSAKDEPLGLRLQVAGDWLLIYPNVDGSMVESRLFKLGRGLGEFEHLGEVVLV